MKIIESGKRKKKKRKKKRKKDERIREKKKSGCFCCELMVFVLLNLFGEFAVTTR